MGVPTIVWALTIVMVAALMLFDYVFHVRHTHVPTLREAALWSAIYVGVAIMFGVGVVIFGSIGMGIEYFAGYLSNEALSVDNLFVFLVVISSFGVPRVAQQKVLLFGVAFALIARTGFILLGGALIEHFNAAFYVFGSPVVRTSTPPQRKAATPTISPSAWPIGSCVPPRTTTATDFLSWRTKVGS